MWYRVRCPSAIVNVNRNRKSFMVSGLWSIGRWLLSVVQVYGLWSALAVVCGPWSMVRGQCSTSTLSSIHICSHKCLIWCKRTIKWPGIFNFPTLFPSDEPRYPVLLQNVSNFSIFNPSAEPGRLPAPLLHHRILFLSQRIPNYFVTIPAKPVAI